MAGRRAPVTVAAACAAALSAAALLCSTCVHRGDRENSRAAPIVARVGPREVTEADLDAELRRVRRRGGGAEAIPTLTKEGRRALAQQLLDAVALSEAARRDGLAELADVRAALANAADRILVRRYLARATAENPVSEPELRSYYASHEGEFSTPEEVYVRHVVVRSAAAAGRLLDEIKRGRPLSDVAAEVNIDGTRMHRGAIGWIRRGVMVAPFEGVAFKLAAGQVSEPVKTDFGWHIIAVEKRRGGEVPPFERVKRKVRKHVQNGRVQQILTTARSRFPITLTNNLETWIERKQTATAGEKDLARRKAGRGLPW